LLAQPDTVVGMHAFSTPARGFRPSCSLTGVASLVQNLTLTQVLMCSRPSVKVLVQAAASSGQPAPRRRKPEWVRLLEEDADVDEDVAKILQGTDGDPDKIREKMRFELQNKDFLTTKEGVETPPKVVFRQINPFGLWVWLEFHQAPSSREQELLESVLKAWFMVGKLGGYNSSNLQVFYNADSEDQSFFDYNNDVVEDAMGSLLHDISEVEFKGSWARFRVDVGTCDELSLDVLINMLMGFSRDLSGLKKVYVGGSNQNWPAPKEEQSEDMFDIDPMKLPEGVDEELELLDNLMAEQQGISVEELRKQEELLGKRADRLAGPGAAGSGQAQEPVASTSGQRSQPWGSALAKKRPGAAAAAGRLWGAATDAQPDPELVAKQKAAAAKAGKGATSMGAGMPGMSTGSTKQSAGQASTSGQQQPAKATFSSSKAGAKAAVAVAAAAAAQKSSGVKGTPGRTAVRRTRKAADEAEGGHAAPAGSGAAPDMTESMQVYSEDEFKRLFPNRGS